MKLNLLFAALMLAGCASVPAIDPQSIPATPAAFKEGDGRWTRVAPAEAQPRGEWWKAFADPVLDDLVARGLRGVRFIVSDDHAGLRAARQAVFPGAVWQRCQFHLAQNAVHHAPNAAIRQRIGSELRGVWNAVTLEAARNELRHLVAAYRSTAPKLADWL